jgi:hypothetical protein
MISKHQAQHSTPAIVPQGLALCPETKHPTPEAANDEEQRGPVVAEELIGILAGD